VKEAGRGVPVLDRYTGKPLLRYDDYRALLLQKAWRIPILLGKLVPCPKTESNAQEKGMYGLLLMLLFRPWRSPEGVLKEWLEKSKKLELPRAPYASDVVWLSLYREYLRWRRDDIRVVAHPYFQRTGPSKPQPAYNSKEWWACMIFLRLSNLELVLSRKKSVKHSMPTDIDGVPIEEDQHSDADSKDGESEHKDTQQGHDACDSDADFADLNQDATSTEKPRESFPLVPEVVCSPLPAGVDVMSFLGEPSNLQTKGPHGSYSREYVKFAPKTVQQQPLLQTSMDFLPPDESLMKASPEWVNAMQLSQENFFKKIDTFEIDAAVSSMTSDDPGASRDTAPKQMQEKVRSVLTTHAGRPRSHTLVLEAAFHLIESGFCNIRAKNVVNVKWALVLMHFATWVQLKMSYQWVQEDLLAKSSCMDVSACAALKELFDDDVDSKMIPVFVMILTGAAGTGKTTIVRMLEAFADYFLGDESLRKSAPTNTAARVVGGDTSHALYKLPFGTLKSKRGSLTAKVLAAYRKKWKGAHGQV